MGNRASYRVFDGDTLELNIDGKTITVRYIGIDAPEIPCYALNFSKPSAPENCDLSCPGICIPSSLPDLDCWDITFRNFTVLPPDPHYFDIMVSGRSR